MTQHTDPFAAGEVVVGCDGSVQAMAAVEWAAAEAARRGARLHILLANPIEYVGLAGPAGMGSGLAGRPVWEHPHDVLHQAEVLATKQLAEESVLTTVADLHPVPAILAASARAILVVLGSRGHGAVGSALLGSVSTTVAEHASCPVVVVRGAVPGGELRRGVTVGVDGSADSLAAVSFAAEVAAARNVSLRILCAWMLTPTTLWHYSDTPWTAAEDWVADVASGALRAVDDARDVAMRGHDGLAISTETPQLPPRVALEEASRTSDLVVVGTRHHSLLERALLGSVSRAILHHAACPVAVVRR